MLRRENFSVEEYQISIGTAFADVLRQVAFEYRQGQPEVLAP